MSSGFTWVQLPDKVPRLTPNVDFELAVLGATLLAHRAPWISAQRWWSFPETGTLYIGAAHDHLRAVYLLQRRGFLIEWCLNGEVRFLGFPATEDDVVRVLRLYLFVAPEFKRLPWVSNEESGDEQRAAWNRAYRRLLGLIGSSRRAVRPLTYEQYKVDVIRAHNLRERVDTLTVLQGKLDARLRLLNGED